MEAAFPGTGGVWLPTCGGCGHTLGQDLPGLSLSRRVTDNVDIVDIEQNMVYYKETVGVLKIDCMLWNIVL